MRLYLYALIIVFSFFSTLLSQETEENKSTTESWYTYWGLGYANISYPQWLQGTVDDLKNQSGVSNLSLSIDMFGFYWHFAPKLIGGFIVNATGDRFTTGRSSIQYNQIQYSGSSIYYFGESFGSGLFARADVGIALLSTSISGGSETISTMSTAGLGVLAGGGWSIDFEGTRLLLNINYAYRRIEKENYNTLSFSVGGLF